MIMKTKYGEIKTLKDYFEPLRTEKVESDYGPGLTRFYEVCKCKVCGDELKGLSSMGAYRSGDKGIDDIQKEHLELHYKIGKSITLTEIEITK